jgi:hypothetical protein
MSSRGLRARPVFRRPLLRRRLLPRRREQVVGGDAEFGRPPLHFRPQRHLGVFELVPPLGFGSGDQRRQLLHRHPVEINSRHVGVFGHLPRHFRRRMIVAGADCLASAPGCY